MRLEPAVITALREALPAVAKRTVDTLTDEVPAYGRADLGTEMAAGIEGAVEMALGAFLRLAAEGQDADPTQPLAPAIEAAYALGRGEARTGRTIDALLAAYRVGARVAWRELSAEMVDRQVNAATIARFAEMVFAYIDQLSASSVAGHADELATSGRAREQYLEHLGRALLDGEPLDRLEARTERADWPPPASLTAVVLPAAHQPRRPPAPRPPDARGVRRRRAGRGRRHRSPARTGRAPQPRRTARRAPRPRRGGGSDA